MHVELAALQDELAHLRPETPDERVEAAKQHADILQHDIARKKRLAEYYRLLHEALHEQIAEIYRQYGNDCPEAHELVAQLKRVYAEELKPRPYQGDAGT